MIDSCFIGCRRLPIGSIGDSGGAILHRHKFGIVRHPYVEYVQCGVQITVQYRAALFAPVGAFRQWHGFPVSAVGADLAARIPAVDVPYHGLVGELPMQFVERRVGDGFRQPVVGEHALDVEVFHEAYPVVEGDPAGGLVQPIRAFAGGPVLVSGEQPARLLPVGRPFLFACERALQMLQPFLAFPQCLRIVDDHAVRTGREVFHAHVDADDPRALVFARRFPDVT